MWRLLRPDADAVLEDERVKKSLGRYFAAVKNEKEAKFLLAKRLAADFSSDASVEELWKKHARFAREFSEVERGADTCQKTFMKMPEPEKSYLDLKVELAERMLSNCHFCTRRCGVNRFEVRGTYCRCGSEITVSAIFPHMGEEPELVPSGTVFTMGCTMRCRHCQNWTISQWMEEGEIYRPERLAEEVERLRAEGCRNVNLVGGEPTPWLQQWLQTFKHVNANVPVVWNSNSYYSPETAQLLTGFVDVYLLDFKYGPGDCARNISDAPNYWEVCTSNHLEAKKNGELIIRVLVLPGHLECCTKPILEWIAKHLGTTMRVNMMFQYRPEWRAHEIPELRRSLTRDEMDRVIHLAAEAGLTNFIT